MYYIQLRALARRRRRRVSLAFPCGAISPALGQSSVKVIIDLLDTVRLIQLVQLSRSKRPEVPAGVNAK